MKGTRSFIWIYVDSKYLPTEIQIIKIIIIIIEFSMEMLPYPHDKKLTSPTMGQTDVISFPMLRYLGHNITYWSSCNLRIMQI